MKESFRRCLGCTKFFWSSGPGERFCGQCRKKRQGRSGMAYLEEIAMTLPMKRHISHIETFGYTPPTDAEAELEAAADAFLENPSKSDFDDSAIYDELAKAERESSIYDDEPDPQPECARRPPRKKKEKKDVQPQATTRIIIVKAVRIRKDTFWF